MSRLEELQKAVDEADAAWEAAAARTAYLKAMQELKAYKKESGL